MINGGGEGLTYLPIANPDNAISTTMTIGRVDASAPTRCAQCSHNLPRSRARQPLRANRSPHTIQKFAACIAGDIGRARALYFISAAKKPKPCQYRER